MTFVFFARLPQTKLREIMDLGDSNGTDECYVNPDNSACRSNRPLDDL
eukprot:SAG31_NODE_2013_length_6665_cov_2.751295_8_plen_48_part_00